MGGNGVGEDCNTGLSLSLGLGSNYHKRPNDHKQHMVCLDLSFTLSTREQAPVLDHKANQCSSLKKMEDEGEEEEEDQMNKNYNFEENDNVNINGKRKKLRLTKEQSSLLEDTFKFCTNLNPGQKQALAEKLKLMPRQVEVWFQNRRARTKLKQTETDCEFLKRCCARLSDENRRLKRELQELQSSKPALSMLPLHLQVPKVTAKLPISCEQPTTTNEGTSVLRLTQP